MTIYHYLRRKATTIRLDGVATQDVSQRLVGTMVARFPIFSLSAAYMANHIAQGPLFTCPDEPYTCMYITPLTRTVGGYPGVQVLRFLRDNFCPYSTMCTCGGWD